MGFKESWKRLQNKTIEDMSDYGETEKTNAYKANSALNTLYASDYHYDTWKNIGIAFKSAGGELADWLAWCSIDASRYEESAATRLFNSVSEDGAITANTLWKLAWNAGWDWHERYEKLPKVKQIPEPRKFNSNDEQAVMQLRAMFEPDDYVNIVTNATLNDKGKWVPSGYGNQYVCKELCDRIINDGIDGAIGEYNHSAGVWVRVNPMNGNGISDQDVKVCRNALVESDDMPIKDQERMLFEMNLPIVCITNSGGKSLHAIVRIDADGRNHYQDRVRYMHEECEKTGLLIDKANKNPSRLTRLAGVERGDSEQTLMHLRIGARDFQTWAAQEKNAKLVYDYGIVPMDMDTPPVLDEVLIDGVMRRGDKMCVAGPSKAYKSFSLIQLAIAIACGEKWFGWKCKQGRVLYINCELRGESFRKRVWEVAQATTSADRSVISENMDVWNMRGRTQPLKTSKDHIIAQGETRNYDVIILDPIYKLFAGDENSAEEVSEFMLFMDELAMRLHASIVYCHHHSKGAKGGVSAQDRFSGSGVFARDCDELVDISPLDLKGHSLTEWDFKASASAWRVETIIRDFEPKLPFDVVFEYPLHHVDETGYLGEFSILSSQTVGGNKRGEQRKEELQENIAKLEQTCLNYFENSTGALYVSDMARRFDVTQRTVMNWVSKSDVLQVVKIGKTNTIERRR